MIRVALTFPGQGSQAAGMADGLLDHPTAARLLAVAVRSGLDLGAALRGDDESLRATEVAQPALLLCGIVLGEIVAGQPGVEVVGCAGHSVGEYSALVAAGALDASTAMELVIARGRAMAEMREGGMVALLGATEEDGEAICDAVGSTASPLVVANLNAPGQIVLSGAAAAIEAVPAAARARGVRRAVRINVSGAFHSPLMARASADLSRRVASVPMCSARVPVACDVDGALVTDVAGLRDRLTRQLTAPVRWVDCVQSLTGLGLDALAEIGPGGTLTALARRIAPEVTGVSVGSIEAAAAFVARLAPAHGESIHA